MARPRGLLVACALLAACGGTPAPAAARVPDRPSGPPLYDRLGRMDAIHDIVVELVEVQLPASPLAPRFAKVERAPLEDGLARMLCELAAGPCHYPGPPLREVHAPMAITEAELEAFLAALERSLVRLHIAPDARADLLSAVRSQHDAIVVPP